MTRRPLYRIRSIPCVHGWLVTPTRDAPSWAVSGAMCPTWASALKYANQKAGETADRESARYRQGGFIRYSKPSRFEQYVRDINYQGGLIPPPPWGNGTEKEA